MSQVVEDPKINALKISSQGQVTLSKEARQLHGLDAGQTLIEVALPGCIVLLPQSQVMADLMLRAQAGLKQLGVTPDQLKAAINKRRNDRLSKRYPRVFGDKT